MGAGQAREDPLGLEHSPGVEGNALCLTSTGNAPREARYCLVFCKKNNENEIYTCTFINGFNRIVGFFA